MISLSTPTFDLAGHVRIDELPETDYGETVRRVSRQKTLDGGVVANDSGYAVGDRTMRVRWRLTSLAQFRSVERLVQTCPQLTVSTRDGVFMAAPERAAISGREGTLTLLVLS